ALEDAEDVLGRVEQAADTGGAVDEKARELAAGAHGLALQQAVHEPGHERDVVETVRDHDLDLVGHDEVIALRHRLEGVLVEALETVLHAVNPSASMAKQATGARRSSAERANAIPPRRIDLGNLAQQYI